MEGEAPPEDIWTPPESRFGHDLNWVRVNRGDYVLVPRRTARWMALAAVGVVAAGVGAAGEQAS